MAKDESVTKEQAHQNAQAIRALWAAGKDSLRSLRQLQRQDPDVLRYRRKEQTFAAEAARLGTNIDKAAKMRRLAQEYTRQQIADLGGLVQKHRSRFSATHLLALLRVEDRSQRDRLMRQAVRHSWTSIHLERAAQAIKGERRQHVGRKPSIPSDPTERLLALHALTAKWCRWTDETHDSLPKSLRPLITTANGAIRKIQNALEGKLKRLETDKGQTKRRS